MHRSQPSQCVKGGNENEELGKKAVLVLKRYKKEVLKSSLIYQSIYMPEQVIGGGGYLCQCDTYLSYYNAQKKEKKRKRL